MKTYHESHNLWKRAPLWRTSLVLGIFFLFMGFIFPLESVQKALPFLNPHYPPVPLHEKHDRSPQALDFKIDIADSEQKISGTLSFAGHNFPLPAGQWRPILHANSHDDLSFISFLREDEGKVTGFLTILASLRPLPSFMIPHIEAVKDKCHDDRLAAHWNAPTYRTTKINCAFVEPVSPLNDPSITHDPFFAAGISRSVNDLAFEFPSMMVSKEWLKLETVPGKGRIFGNVTLWEVPISEKLNQPPVNWHFFFRKVCQDLPLWAHLLSEAFDGHLYQKLPPKHLNMPAPSKTQAIKA